MRSAVRAGRSAALALLAALVAACGDNLYSPESSAPRASVSAPEVVLPGDTFYVLVDGFAPRGAARIDLSLRAAIQRDTIMILYSYPPMVAQRFRFIAPAAFSDQVLIVNARIFDKRGVNSGPASDTAIAVNLVGGAAAGR